MAFDDATEAEPNAAGVVAGRGPLAVGKRAEPDPVAVADIEGLEPEEVDTELQLAETGWRSGCGRSVT